MVDQKGFKDGASTLRLVGHEDVAGTGEDFQARVGRTAAMRREFSIGTRRSRSPWTRRVGMARPGRRSSDPRQAMVSVSCAT